MTDLETMDVRFKIAAARRMLYRNGCDSTVGGHVTVRDEADDGSFWTTPFEYFDETVPLNVARVTADLEIVEGTIDVSPAIRFHAEIYSRRPDVRSIIHTHSEYVMALGSRGEPIGGYSDAAVVFVGRQAIFEEVSEDIVSATRLADALGDMDVLIMKNHGAIVTGPTLERTTVEAMMLEHAARTEFQCIAVGGTPYVPEAITAMARGYRQFYEPQMWIANLRRLRRSDPDLFEAALPTLSGHLEGGSSLAG